jgi:hypothetical protein
LSSSGVPELEVVIRGTIDGNIALLVSSTISFCGFGKQL